MNKFDSDSKVSFSLRKIPTVKNPEIEILDEGNYDKVKILELSNSIDKWEEELLLSDEGFFSLKGKKIQGKTKEFLKDLNEFISRKIFELKFQENSSNNIVSEVKRKKLEVIKNKMQHYEQEQLRTWELDVYEEALSFAIKKAIFYKNNEEMISLSLKNAFEILKVMAEKEAWSEKTFIKKKEQFEGSFYLALINAFFIEKDLKAEVLFEKVKNKISAEEKEKLADCLKQMKQEVIALNFAKELFSYDLPKDKVEKEVKKIKNCEIEKLVCKFLKEFEDDNKKNKEKMDEEKNERNWNEIISKLKEDSQIAFLHIDRTLSSETQKAKREYIEQIRKKGYIQTEIKKFNSLIDEFFEDLEVFKNKHISNLRANLSIEDFSLITKLKEITFDEYVLLFSDYEFLKKRLFDNQKIEEKEKYNLFKLLVASKNSYISINKKEPDLEKRNKLIEAILERNNRKE